MNKILFFCFFLINYQPYADAMEYNTRRFISLIEASFNGSLFIKDNKVCCADILTQECLFFSFDEIKRLNKEAEALNDETVVTLEKKLALIALEFNSFYPFEKLYNEFPEEYILKVQLRKLHIFKQPFFTVYTPESLVKELALYREKNRTRLTHILVNENNETLVNALIYWEQVIKMPLKVNDQEFIDKFNSCLRELKNIPIKSLKEELTDLYKEKIKPEKITNVVRNPYSVMISGWNP